MQQEFFTQVYGPHLLKEKNLIKHISDFVLAIWNLPKKLLFPIQANDISHIS